MISRGKRAQIHIARQQLGLTDEDYRSILAREAGVSSSKELTDRGVTLVLNELKRLGFRPRPPRRAGRVPNTFSKHEQLAKVEAQLAEMGLSWAYAEAIAKQQTGLAKLEWLRTEAQFKGVIAALAVEQDKRSLLARVDRELARLGMDRSDVPTRWQVPPRWERKLKTLEALAELLCDMPDPSAKPN